MTDGWWKPAANMAAPKAAPEMKDAMAAHAHVQISIGLKVFESDKDKAKRPLFNYLGLQIATPGSIVADQPSLGPVMVADH